jgi:hypothetical protein
MCNKLLHPTSKIANVLALIRLLQVGHVCSFLSGTQLCYYKLMTWLFGRLVIKLPLTLGRFAEFPRASPSGIPQTCLGLRGHLITNLPQAMLLLIKIYIACLINCQNNDKIIFCKIPQALQNLCDLLMVKPPCM